MLLGLNLGGHDTEFGKSMLAHVHLKDTPLSPFPKVLKITDLLTFL